MQRAIRLVQSIVEQHIQNNQLSEAIEICSSAIQSNPLSCELYLLRAEAYALLEEYDESVKDAESALSLDTSAIQAYFRLALSLSLTGQFTKALSVASQGLEIDSTHSLLHELKRDLTNFVALMPDNRFEPSASVEQTAVLPRKQLLPVTILSGFLGSGKTTLLNNILHNKQNLRVAVIVNDMSEVNIDSKLVHTVRADENMVEMSNGCVCCTLRMDLLEHIAELAKQNRFDYLVVEGTGISEPLPVAQTFSFTDKLGQSLSELARLDTMVTVVDSYNFLKDYDCGMTLKDRSIQATDTDEREIVNLLVDQVEFANVILLNKIDLVSTRELGSLKSIISKLNPTARIYEAKFALIPNSHILNTGLFDLQAAQQSNAWQEELKKPEHVPETLEYGILSFPYKRRRPFHPERLWNAIKNDELGKITRSKGFFWLASDQRMCYEWATCGSVFRFVIKGYWLITLLESQRGAHELLHQQLSALAEWQEPYGDRRQELVFIGININKDKIIQVLDSCLLNDEEMVAGPKQWRRLVNPFKQAEQATM